eukprot:evm.model.scf_416.3 EVM.evm.TU.scf_416.3   scf_416:50932-55509(-)
MGSASGLFSANPSSSVFGKQSGPSTAFGSQSVTPAFGSSMPGTGAFGQTTFSSQPTFTGGSAFPLPQRPKGTGRTPFVPKVFVEPDGTGKKPNMCTWHHVSFGDAYKGVPQELLRYEDYQQGNTGGGGLTQGQGAQSTFSPGGLSSQPSLFGGQVIIVNAAPKQRYPAIQLPLSIPPASSRRSLRRSSRSHSRLLSDSDSLFSDQLWRGTASPPRGMDEPLFKREDVKENLGSWDIKACLERTGSSPALLMPGGKGAGGDEANDGSAKETSEEPLRLKNTATSDGESNLSKEDISRLLPAVPQPEYYTRPDLRGLSNMLHADRHALKQVHGLTVGRTGYGELKFLEPVNVEGLNVCDLVSITRGMVSLYEKSPKRDVPVPGQGLNQPAEVKLLDIFKTDKRGEVLDDQASKVAFKNSLKKYCKRVDATFVSYDMEDGTWIFRVNNLV